MAPNSDPFHIGMPRPPRQRVGGWGGCAGARTPRTPRPPCTAPSAHCTWRVPCTAHGTRGVARGIPDTVDRGGGCGAPTGHTVHLRCHSPPRRPLARRGWRTSHAARRVLGARHTAPPPPGALHFAHGSPQSANAAPLPHVECSLRTLRTALCV